MASVDLRDQAGKKAGSRDLPAELFEAPINVGLMHQVVVAGLAAIRRGTHSTKTRGEVRGGGRKPWRQKGTGRARHGSIREPQWVGGGIAHGPKPRDYSFRLTKKTRALALRGALSDRAREGSIVVVDLPVFDEPRTKRARGLLESWGADGKVLVVTGQGSLETHVDTWKSFRNLPNVLMVQTPTTYRVLAADVVVIKNSYGLIDHDTYTLLLPRAATKVDVRHAVESIWGVRVVAVNTLNRRRKTKRTRNVVGERASTKRAIVKLAPGDKIELFE